MRMASTQIDLISKKNKLHAQHTFSSNQQKANFHVQHAFLSFPCRCFARLQRCFVRLKRQTSQLHIIFMEEFSYVVYPIFCFLRSCSLLLFTAAHFHLAGHQHFSFSHPSPCFSPYEFVSFVFNNSLQLFLCYPSQCKNKK